MFCANPLLDVVTTTSAAAKLSEVAGAFIIISLRSWMNGKCEGGGVSPGRPASVVFAIGKVNGTPSEARLDQRT